MIEIEVVLDEGGVLRACKASGHAGAGRTWFYFSRARRIKNIVCASVSVLVWAAVHALSDRKGITVRCDAPEPGLLALEADYEADGREFLYAAGVFLLKGLETVVESYPRHCKLDIRRT